MNDGVYGLLKGLFGGFAAILALGFTFGVALAAGEYVTRWVLGGAVSAMLERLSP